MSDFTAMEAEYQDVQTDVREHFANVDTIPCVHIPWGDDEDAEGFTVSGLMVDVEYDAEDRPALRIGVYSDVGEPCLAMLYTYTAEDTLALLEILTEQQPEGTDWASWAAHWVNEIWPDIAAAIERGEQRL